MAKFRALMHSNDGVNWELMNPENLWEAMRIGWMLWRHPGKISALIARENEMTLAEADDSNRQTPPRRMTDDELHQCLMEAMAEVERLRKVQAKYNELLYAVCAKTPGESRHQTALRYITQAENRHSHGPSSAPPTERYAHDTQTMGGRRTMRQVGDDHYRCHPDPRAPHGFNRNASHSEGRYVCDCEGWESDDDYADAYDSAAARTMASVMKENPSYTTKAYGVAESWPDEQRIDTIASNGPTGEHYSDQQLTAKNAHEGLMSARPLLFPPAMANDPEKLK